MIAAWMLTASFFGLFAAVAAACGEQLLRALGRPARGAWAAAIVATLAWPLAMIPDRSVAPGVPSAVTLPPIRITALVPASLAPSSDAWLPRVDRVLLALWIAGSLLLLARLAVAVVRAGRLRAHAGRAVVGGVPVLVSEGVGPAVLGVVRPEIVFPRTLLSLEAPLRDVIVRHEEEHRAARDPWLSFGCGIALVLTPWNPALWWMTRRARLALEIDCDRRVLRAGVSPARYGKLLLLVSQSDQLSTFAPALVSSPTHLERRIRAMLSTHPSHPRIRAALALGGVILAGLAACSAHVVGGDPLVRAPEAVAVFRRESQPTTPLAPSPRVAKQRTMPNAIPDTGARKRVPSETREGGANPAPMPNAIAPGDTDSTPRAQKQPYFEFQVEQPARQRPPESRTIVYPPELKAAMVEGEVLAQFVVDTLGAPVAGTLRVLRSSHALFSAAVSDAVPKLRFEPARIGGRKVEQLVQQPFIFALPR